MATGDDIIGPPSSRRTSATSAHSDGQGAGPRESPSGVPRSVARPRDGGLRRDLIAAALELVETAGTQGLSLREIARKAGVSHAAPYRHFANKEELLAAVAEQGFRTLAQRVVEQEAAAPQEVLARFEAIAIAYVEFAAENPAHFRVMFSPEIADIAKHPSLQEVRDSTAGLLRSGVAEVLAGTGAIGSKVDVDDFTLLAWSLVHGLASLVVDGHVRDLGQSPDDPGKLVRNLTGLIETLAGEVG